MSELRLLQVPDEHPPQRLDGFLAEALPDISRSQIQKLIADGQVLLDGKAVKASTKLKGGEALQLELPDPVASEAQPEAIPLCIVYEDSDLLVVNKPAGMVVHPAAGHASGTLVNALLHHCQDLAGIGGELRPGIVHRIDKDTSGLLVVTKNDAAHLQLAAQFKQHSIKRRYLALIHGCPAQRSGVIDQPIGRHPVQRKKMSSKARQGKSAVTHWRLLRDYPQARMSLLELQLETGRTHQIRVHFSEQNMPLVGDPLYGNRSRTNTLKDVRLKQLIAQLPGQALHAASLGFIHPQSGKMLEFSCEMPDTLQHIIDYLDQLHEVGEQPVAELFNRD